MKELFQLPTWGKFQSVLIFKIIDISSFLLVLLKGREGKLNIKMEMGVV